MKRSELLRHIADDEDNGGNGFSRLMLDGNPCNRQSKYYWNKVLFKPEQFTLKPRTHKVNGFEVPAPISRPKDLNENDYFFFIHPFKKVCKWYYHCLNEDQTNEGFRVNAFFETQEHAELNRKAQLKINPYKEGE